MPKTMCSRARSRGVGGVTVALAFGALVAAGGCTRGAQATRPAPRADGVGGTPIAAGASTPVEQVARLSLALRRRRLSLEERAEIARDPRAPDEVYARYLDRWFEPTVLDRLFPPGEPPVPYLFLEQLAVYDGEKGRGPVLYLPSIHPDADASRPPCSPADRVAVVPWWSAGSTVDVCRQSFRPEKMFDDVGYCGGQAEVSKAPTPRPGCGCGALLLACLPPESTAPGFQDRLAGDLRAEVVETGRRMLWEGRSLAEVMTTSRTWQSGLVRFMYLRRELVGMASREPYTPALAERMANRLRRVDLTAGGQWVDRAAPYDGSGNVVAVPYTKYFAYRTMAHALLEGYLCVEFKGVNVDSEHILQAVGDDHANVRGFTLGESALRTREGCSGCHAPLDGTAAFLTELSTLIYGQYPTGAEAKGALYVTGAEDLRGRGAGLRDLMKLVVAQPEFDRCTVRRIYDTMIGSHPPAHELDAEVARYVRESRDVRGFARSLFLSPEFRGWLDYP